MPDFSFLEDGGADDGTIRINTAPAKRPSIRVAAPKKDPSTALGCLLMCALLGGCVYVVSHIPPQTDAEFEQDDNRSLAVANAQEHIKSLLVAPRSAKWPGILDGVDVKTNAVRLTDGTYIVRSFVDSQNAMGAMLRTHYVVHLRVLKNGNAVIINSQFLSDH